MKEKLTLVLIGLFCVLGCNAEDNTAKGKQEVIAKEVPQNIELPEIEIRVNTDKTMTGLARERTRLESKAHEVKDQANAKVQEVQNKVQEVQNQADKFKAHLESKVKEAKEGIAQKAKPMAEFQGMPLEWLSEDTFREAMSFGSGHEVKAPEAKEVDAPDYEVLDK